MGQPAGVAREPALAERPGGRLRWTAELDRLRDSGRLYLFAPLCLALGILLYFALPHEPSAPILASVALGLAWFGRHALLGRAAALVVAGLALPALHAALLGDLPRTLPDGPRRVAGILESVEGREGDGGRIVLRVSEGVLGAERLQLTMRERPSLLPGTPVTVVAALSYAPGPVSPGQYDHARRLYFEGIDTIGVVIAGPYQEAEGPVGPLDRARRAIAGVRLGIAGRIDAVLEGQTAALATALLTGSRDGLSTETLDAMRGSGLAHVLAISGMHMGLFCTSLFLALRAVFALVGAGGLRLPAKKLAAMGALLGGTFYLLISGAQIATQRAYVMTAIVCLAVLLDRPALTLRNVATAALVVLALSPESLMGASFQMSFAATIALIAVYERWNARSRASETLLAIPGQQVSALFITSLTAGLATAPYASFHFSRIATYGLLANLAAMPFVTALVMPAGLASLIAMPLGLETFPLVVMGWGLDGLLGVARTVASWPNAMRAVPSPAPAALVLGSVGLYGLAIAPVRTARLAGITCLAGALVLHFARTDPLVAVAENGKTFAVVGQDGSRDIVGGRFSRFTEARWEERDAYRSPPDDATDEDRFCDDERCVRKAAFGIIVAAWRPESLQEACLTADILLTPLDAPRSCPAPSITLSAPDFGAGSLAITKDGEAFRVRPVTPRDRPWRRPREGRPRQ